MTDAVIVATARTPIGRARKGSLVDVDAFTLAQVAVGGAIDRAGVPLDDIDDLIVAESLEGGGVIARYVAVDMGMVGVPGLADNRHCAAGLSAVQLAAGSIRAGMDRVVVAGGTESLSSMPMATKSIPASAQDPQPWMSPSHPETPDAPAWDMSITVGENAARLAGLTRADVDEWAALTHQRACASIAAFIFVNECTGMTVASLPPPTMYSPVGSTSTPCGDLGVGRKYTRFAHPDGSMMRTDRLTDEQIWHVVNHIKTLDAPQ